jgi:hypothetical protein
LSRVLFPFENQGDTAPQYNSHFSFLFFFWQSAYHAIPAHSAFLARYWPAPLPSSSLSHHSCPAARPVERHRITRATRSCSASILLPPPPSRTSATPPVPLLCRSHFSFETDGWLEFPPPTTAVFSSPPPHLVTTVPHLHSTPCLRLSVHGTPRHRSEHPSTGVAEWCNSGERITMPCLRVQRAWVSFYGIILKSWKNLRNLPIAPYPFQELQSSPWDYFLKHRSALSFTV